MRTHRWGVSDAVAHTRPGADTASDQLPHRASHCPTNTPHSCADASAIIHANRAADAYSIVYPDRRTYRLLR